MSTTSDSGTDIVVYAPSCAILTMGDSVHDPAEPLGKTSPCLTRMRKVMDDTPKRYEPVEFATNFLLERLTLSKLAKKVAIHPTCSTRLMRLAEPFRKLAELCAEEVV